MGPPFPIKIVWFHHHIPFKHNVLAFKPSQGLRTSGACYLKKKDLLTWHSTCCGDGWWIARPGWYQVNNPPSPFAKGIFRPACLPPIPRFQSFNRSSPRGSLCCMFYGCQQAYHTKSFSKTTRSSTEPNTFCLFFIHQRFVGNRSGKIPCKWTRSSSPT